MHWSAVLLLICVFLWGLCSVSQSPLVSGISGIFKLSAGLHFETCSLLLI